jgi:hypothetical protein
MTLAFPCDDNAVCVEFNGDAMVCVLTCEEHTDCPDGQGCHPDALEGAGICWPVCEMDSQCKTTERCNLGRFIEPELGACEAFCDPSGGGMAGAITCETDDVCVQVDAMAYGFCKPRNRLCSEDRDCHDEQVCEVLNDDAFGRCVNGCQMDTDCAGAGQECKLQTGSTHGICRAPGGVCVWGLGLHGDAQCVDSQECSASMAGEVGTCVDRA